MWMMPPTNPMQTTEFECMRNVKSSNNMTKMTEKTREEPQTATNYRRWHIDFYMFAQCRQMTVNECGRMIR